MKKQLTIYVLLFIVGQGFTNAQSILFSEDFQTTTGIALPTLWSQATFASDGGWKSGAALNSTYFYIPPHTRYLATNEDACNCDKHGDFLVSPPINLSGVICPVLSFDYYYYNNYYSSYHESASVEVSINGGTSWVFAGYISGVAGNSISSTAPWKSHGVNLSGFAGLSNVLIGILYNDGGGWGFGIAIDNFTVFQPPINAITVNNSTMDKYVLAGNQTVKTLYTSYGASTVTSTTFQYSVDGGITCSQVFYPSLNYAETDTAVFTTPANLTGGLHIIKSWVSDINGAGPDSIQANDTVSWQITVLPGAAPAKKVLLEEFAAVWCGYDPRAGLTLTTLCNSNTNIIGAALHNGDAMTNADGSVIDASYIYHYPAGLIDRSYFASQYDYLVDDPNWAALAATRLTKIVPATVTVSANYDTITRVITATVTATFVGAVKGNFAINCYVTENRVYGPLADISENGYNTHNYFWGSTSTPFYNVGLSTAPWSTTSAGLMPADYVHNHVVETMMGGPYGDTTVVPSTLVPAGTSFSKTFTYTLPPSNPGGAHRYNPENLYIVGMVQEYNSNHLKPEQYILNVTEQKLNMDFETGLSGSTLPATSIYNQLETSSGLVLVYPNPCASQLRIRNYELGMGVVEMYDVLGERVYKSEVISQNSKEISVDISALAKGIYFVRIISEGNIVYSEKIIKE